MLLDTFSLPIKNSEGGDGNQKERAVLLPQEKAKQDPLPDQPEATQKEVTPRADKGKGIADRAAICEVRAKPGLVHSQINSIRIIF